MHRLVRGTQRETGSVEQDLAPARKVSVKRLESRALGPFSSSWAALVAALIRENSRMLGQKHHRLVVTTNAQGFTNITAEVQRWLAAIGTRDGLLTLFVQHTSASLVIQENTDPDVLRDLTDALDHLAPQDRTYRHDLEGPDDMPAHIKAMLTSTSLSIPVLGGRATLGQWQAIYLAEHRTHPHQRQIVLHYLGEFSP